VAHRPQEDFLNYQYIILKIKCPAFFNKLFKNLVTLNYGELFSFNNKPINYSIYNKQSDSKADLDLFG